MPPATPRKRAGLGGRTTEYAALATRGEFLTQLEAAEGWAVTETGGDAGG